MMFSSLFTDIGCVGGREILCFYPSVAEYSEDEVIALFIKAYQQQFSEGLLFSNDEVLQQSYGALTMRATQDYLGMTTSAVFLDVRKGFPLDYFLSIAATIKTDGILILLMGPSFSCDESTRFHHEAIKTPYFNHFLQEKLTQYSYMWKEGVLLMPRCMSLAKNSLKSVENRLNDLDMSELQISDEQKGVMNHFLSQDSGVFTLFSPRGTGKSWLASQIIKADVDRYILTSPNQNAINQYQHISNLQFRAPDALFLNISEDDIQAHTLIIEEAAKMPLSHLERLCRRFKKVLMISSVENYEGTGQGLREKIHDLVVIKKGYQLTQLQRFSEDDRLKALCDQLMFLESVGAENKMGAEDNETKRSIVLKYYDDTNIDQLRSSIGLMQSLYHLLNQTHYQTNVQDIRRLLDAPNQVFVLAHHNEQLVGAIWAIEEGGLSSELTEAVWNGLRRPKGNLVAQMLTSQSYFPEAMRARSIRISRISVKTEYRRQAIGGDMVSFLEKYVIGGRPEIDFISVSFGLTEHLLKFWESLQYKMVHLGFHLDKTTGLHSAVVLKALKDGVDWISEAVMKFCADAHLNVEVKPYKPDVRVILRQKAYPGIFDQRDISVIKAFEDYKRGKHTVENALNRQKNQNNE